MTKFSLKRTLVGLVAGLSVAGFTLAAAPAQAAVATDGTYVTKEGDTFWKVSRKLHIPLQDLLDANPDISPYNVYAGLTFKLPKTRVLAASVSPKQGPAVTTASGKQLAYSKELTAVASAYTDSPAENGGYAGIDYFGNPLKFGTIAVDPNVIPLGSKVYVTGYSFAGMPTGFVATASDIGGAIKGNRIDIFLPGSMGNAEDFGLQKVKLYVLKS
jgi:3D (Asp-Asp-Asp) domain-containing protein